MSNFNRNPSGRDRSHELPAVGDRAPTFTYGNDASESDTGGIGQHLRLSFCIPKSLGGDVSPRFFWRRGS